ncbi:MAG: U32 family peptidase [Fibrobacter sp.]|jgi:putative protease|nr:U32 family peptidase [Fibrobacter sp.]
MELLLPVATREMALAAIRNGADALYIGVPGFNARGRTEDLALAEIREIIRLARIREVKTFLAMNVLIYESELADLSGWVETLVLLAPDAFIVQDIGLARLIRAIAPGQELHASTQMTVTSAEAIRLLSGLGFSRYVLARELSLKQIKEIKENTTAEIEIFAHGALCISYSGQCLTSENFGGRSANRGQCAQSCRLPYRLFVNEKEAPLQGKHYLFSSQDLSALPVIKEIQALGVESLKIEGRLKSPEYVAAAAAAYRSVLDSKNISAFQQESLEVLFSRGFSTGWLEGVNHLGLIEGFHSNHHGKKIGTLERVEKHSVFVTSETSVQPGDGILFEAPGIEPGGCRVYEVKTSGKVSEIILDPHWNTGVLKPGMTAFLNDSPRIEKYWRKSFSGRETEKRFPVAVELEGHAGERVKLVFHDGTHSVTVFSDFILERAQKPQPAEYFHELFKKEFGALAETAYTLENFSFDFDRSAFINQKMVRLLKQRALRKLDARRAYLKRPKSNPDFGRAFIRDVSGKFRRRFSRPEPLAAQLSVLVREPAQINELEGLPLHSVIMDFDWGVDYTKPLEQIRRFGFLAGMATLRIQKPGETHYLKRIERLNPDFILVRNLGSLAFFKDSQIPLHGDYSLNAANLAAAEWLLNQGLESIHPSLDLNSEQLFRLLETGAGEPFEIALHQYMPAFHMEHCLFAVHLAHAPRFPECRKVCLQHSIEILDHKGERHFLQADAECRNTLFVGKPQTALKLLPKLREAGVFRYRLEMLHDTPETVRRKIQIVSGLLQGKMLLNEAVLEIGAEEKYGISEGQLFNASEWKNRKKSSKAPV